MAAGWTKRRRRSGMLTMRSFQTTHAVRIGCRGRGHCCRRFRRRRQRHGRRRPPPKTAGGHDGSTRPCNGGRRAHSCPCCWCRCRCSGRAELQERPRRAADAGRIQCTLCRGDQRKDHDTSAVGTEAMINRPTVDIDALYNDIGVGPLVGTYAPRYFPGLPELCARSATAKPPRTAAPAPAARTHSTATGGLLGGECSAAAAARRSAATMPTPSHSTLPTLATALQFSCHPSPSSRNRPVSCQFTQRQRRRR